MGGVICLTLGANKPDNLTEIIQVLDEVSKDENHYIISVYDTQESRFLGDCELVRLESDGITYRLSQLSIVSNGSINVFSYFFTASSYRRTKEYYSLSNILSRLKELENKINELATINN